MPRTGNKAKDGAKAGARPGAKAGAKPGAKSAGKGARASRRRPAKAAPAKGGGRGGLAGLFGIGRKDEHGKQVRIEHRGKHTRASRTGGVALRTQTKVGAVNLTANTSRGLRASTRIGRGARVALQNGRFQLIGRLKHGPVTFNVSKTGVSGSLKNRAGAINFVKPQYSSFKVGGVHVRGRKAAQLQLIYLCMIGAVMLITLAFQLAVFVIRLAVYLLWLAWALLIAIVSAIVTFAKEMRRDE